MPMPLTRRYLASASQIQVFLFSLQNLIASSHVHCVKNMFMIEKVYNEGQKVEDFK